MSRTPLSGRIVKQKYNFSVILERVLGFTSVNNCSVALSTKNPTFFYIAGCVIVGESCETNNQFIVQSTARKSLTCLDVSQDGRYLITGESGHQPLVRIWNLADGRLIGTLSSHHFRISSVRFCPVTATHIVSVGCQEDQTICVWDRLLLQKVASAKVSARVNAVAFSDDGEFFVTVGIRHVRFWYIDLKKRIKRIKETQPLKGRNAVLGDMLHNTFTDVCCSTGPTEVGGDPEALTLVLSQAGQLVQINAARCVAKWVDLKVSSASCMALSMQTVAVGCASGVCLLFSANTLRFITRVPLPHFLGASISSSNMDVSTPIASSASCSEEARYAEVVAIKLDLAAGHLVCMYADHSLYFWNVKDLKSISRLFAHFYHSRAVCAGAVTTSVACIKPGETDFGRWTPADPVGTPVHHVEHFVTCSDDDTIRIWSFPVNCSILKSHQLFPDGKEEVSVLYTDANYSNLCSDERNSNAFGATYFGQGSTLNLSAPSSPAPVKQMPGRWSSNVNIVTAQSGSGSGLRSIAISPDGRHLAVGDRSGQLKIYDFKSFKLLHGIRAHDAEILSVNFFESRLVPEMALLCTSSRDRVIHVFAPRQDYSRVQTLADHSGVVNSALFFESEENRRIYLISCGADRSLLFRVLSTDTESQTARFMIERHISVTHSCSCATVVGPSMLASTVSTENGLLGTLRPRIRQYLAVACQDRQLRFYQVTKARQLLHYRASTSEDGSPICCVADPTSTLIATAGSDKQINLFHLFTGEHVATLYGHADIVMALIFLPDLRHLVSVSYDSCIFVWRFAPELTAMMLDRQQRIAAALTCASNSTDTSTLETSLLNASLQRIASGVDGTGVCENVKFCSNEADLPFWARGKPLSEYCSLPGRGTRRSLTELFGPTSAAADTTVTHVLRSHSDRTRPWLASKRQRNRTIGTAPVDLSRVSSSLGHLTAASSRSSSTSRSCGGDRSVVETTCTPSMLSSMVFPRWASSVVDVTQENPFEPPSPSLRSSPQPRSVIIKNNCVGTPLPLTSSLSSEVLSPFTEPANRNVDSMTGCKIEDNRPKMSKVEEINDMELKTAWNESNGREAMKFLLNQVPSVRTSWLETDAAKNTSVADTEDMPPSRDVILARPQRVRSHLAEEEEEEGCACGQSIGCLTETDFGCSQNPVSSTSESASALSLLSNVCKALDVAIENLGTATSDVDGNVIRECRDFFCSHLKWRVARLSDLLHAEPPIPSLLSSSSSPTRTTSSPTRTIADNAMTRHFEGSAPSQTAVVELIERLMPSIRTAVAETLTSGAGGCTDAPSGKAHGTLEASADFLPAD